jgi:hypothetical protein
MNEQITTALRTFQKPFVIGGAIALAAIIAAALLYFFNPVEHAFYPRCMFHVVTGLDCPGCGGLRATHQLLHGNVRTALQLNPLAVVLLPLSFGGGIHWLITRRTGNSTAWQRPKVLWMFAVVVVAFGLLRNLPWRTWLG